MEIETSVAAPSRSCLRSCSCSCFQLICRRDISSAVLFAALFSGAGLASAAPQIPASLADLSLEDLARIEVISASKKPERLADVAASVYVISAQDIRRSGAINIPEILRLAPNLQVARINANNYAINARGFNTTTSNKLLVLIDGRTVYTPLYSGVFWDSQGMVLGDIERVEVVSGPGGTLWGANAVNGVINIITRHAKDTQGTRISVGSGNQESNASVRHGGEIGSHGHYRVYGKFSDVMRTSRANGNLANDEWNKGQAGFRTDWTSGNDWMTVQGDAYAGRIDQSNAMIGTISGENLLGRWSRQQGDTSRQLQVYIDQTRRNIPASFTETLRTLDLQYQHGFSWAGNHSLLWGAGYRYAIDRVGNSTVLAFYPPYKILQWADLFVQDEIRLRENLRLTVGTKLQYNGYTGLDYLPSIRLAWKPSDQALLWGAWSRAVREPSRIDREFFVPAQPPYLLAGGPDFTSEISNTFELGYRAQPSPILSYSVTAFHARHSKLRSLENKSGVFIFENRMFGTTSGIEAWGSYQVMRSWRLSAGVTWLRQLLHLEPGSTGAGVAIEGNDPSHTWVLRSSHDLSERSDFDFAIRHVGALPNPAVPAYTAVDMRYAHRLRPGLEASVTLLNLFDPRHPEFGTAATRSEIGRSLYLKLVWRL